jgi:excisionase family DNA binding protein
MSSNNRAAGRRPFLRPIEAARIYDVNIKTIYAAIKRGDLESVRVGRTLRIPREAIERVFG